MSKSFMPQITFLFRISVVALAILLNVAIWSNWESILPAWIRFCVAAMAVTVAVLAVTFHCKWIAMVAFGTLLFTSWCTYLMLPINGETVGSQISKSQSHLSRMPPLQASLQTFSKWLEDGQSVHSKSPLFQSWFRSSAAAEVRRAVLLTQQRLAGTLDEIAVYEEWQSVFPGFLQSLDDRNEPVRRMNQILKASQGVQQTLSNCQDAVREGDYERLKFVRRGLENDESLAIDHEYLNLFARQLIAEAERLEYLNSIATGE